MITAVILAATAIAPPTVLPETIWRTTAATVTFHPAPRAAPPAPDGDGYVVAWSEVENGISRAFAGKLNSAGELTTTGVRTAGVADAPVVAPFGGRTLAAWLEPDSVDGRPTLVTGALDRDLGLVAARPIGLSSGAPAFGITPARAYLGAGNFLYEVDVNGAPGATFDAPRPIDALATDGDQIAFVSHALPLLPLLNCCFKPPPQPTVKYEVRFTWLFRMSASLVVPVRNDSLGAISGGRQSFLVVWWEPSSPPAIKASLFAAEATFHPIVVSIRAETRADVPVTPQAAWDGARWVAIWTHGDEIEGAVIDPSLQAQTFRVAERGSRPAITASKPGRFLVTYEVIDGATRRLASRILDFNGAAGRGRAIR